MRIDLQLAGVLLGWLAGWWLLWRVPRVPRRPLALVPDPTVSVIIPARNEARHLPVLLAALGAQDRPVEEIIVVDDDSTDGTGDVAAAAGAIVVTSSTLPPGWTGKAWACWQGAQRARGEVLVFLDADTEPAPDCLARVVAAHARDGGLLSVQPYHRMERPYERLAALFNVVAFMGVGAATPWKRSRIVGAFGPCLVCHRDEYLTLGGHEAVRSAVLEDIALAEHFQDAGARVRVYGGRGVIAFRMYPEGIGQLVEGFGKNIASGANALPLTRVFLVFAWVTALLSAAYDLLSGLAGGWPGVVTVLLYAAFALQIGVFLHQLGGFGASTSLLYPLPAVAFLGVFAWSLLLQIRGEVRWKGRTIPVRAGPGGAGR